MTELKNLAGAVLQRIRGNPKTSNQEVVLDFSSSGATSVSSGAALRVVERRFREMHIAEAATAAKEQLQK